MSRTQGSPTSLNQAWRTFPVTLVLIVVCIGLYFAAHALAASRDITYGDAQRVLGAPESLNFVAFPELNGLLDVWDGQWWRIPLGALHHGGLLHIAMNMVGFWVLGALLEPRMGSVRYFVFLALAACVSMLPEALFEQGAVGISGPLFAMFGVLLALRPRDAQIQEVLTPGVIQLAIGWVFLCIALTALNLWNIANLAHFSGWIYGALYGRLLLHEEVGRPARIAFWAGHLLLVPGFYFVQHPVWLPRYDWYLAATTDDSGRKIEHLREALRRDPGLALAWVQLAEAQRQRGDLTEAWRTVLTGIDINRAEKRAVEYAREDLWPLLVFSDLGWESLGVLREIFGDEFAQWQPKLAPAKVQIRNSQGELLDIVLGDAEPSTAIHEITLAPPVEGPKLPGGPWDDVFPAGFPELDPAARMSPQLDEDAPDSAVEGRQI